MLHLVYSNFLEELTEALAERLSERRQRPGASLFDTLYLVTPNRHIDAFARAALARRHGIAFNLTTWPLDELLPGLLETSGKPWKLLDLVALRGLLLGALLDGGGDDEELAPVSDYLRGGAQRAHREDAAELRKFQLATELAQVFAEYSRSSPELLAAWRRGEFGVAGLPAHEEAWQRALWLRLFGPGGAIETHERVHGVRWVRFEELIDPLSPWSLDRLELPGQLHLVGVSHGGSGFGKLLSALSRRSEVHVYALNPCAEFWEDVAPPRQRRAQAPLAIEEEPDTPLLRLWGRPGRDGARVLNELAGYQFEERFRDPGDESLLGRLQRDILVRSPERREPDPDAHADDSLRVLACPGVRRELEVIASEIWERLRRDPDLKMHEIAVVVGVRESTRYLPQLQAVFAETGGLQTNVLDLPVASDGRVVEAVELLLSLPFGSFGRHELLRLCTHPLIAGRCPDDDPDEWVRWCDGVGIVRGADRGDHQGTYVTRDLFNWEQGVRRLALGAFLTGERSGDARGFAADGDAYLPEEHTQAGQLGAGRFGLLVRSLIADARFAREGARSLADWARFMALLATSYLAPATEAQEKELTRCLEALQRVDDGSVGASPVSYRLAYQLALAALAEQRANRGQLMGGGVVVGPLHRLRGLPFKVIFATGLGEGRFPEVERRRALDLRGDRPGGQREQDKYAFLELLLGARQALVLSYVHRDLATQEEMPASSLVLDLLDVLKRGYVPSSEHRLLVEEHRLRRFDPAYFPDVYQLGLTALPSWQPEARREAQSVELRRQLGQGAPVGPALLRSVERQHPQAWPLLKEHLRLYDLPAAPPLPDELRLRLTSLRRFLECPLQGYARHALGLTESEEDVMAIEDEPFVTGPKQAAPQLRAWMTEALVSGADPLALLAQRVELLEQRGRAPTGIFGDVEQQTHRAWLRRWYDQARKLLGDGVRAEVVRFGSPEEQTSHERLEPPIELEIPFKQGARRATLTGVTGPLLRGRRGSLFFVHKPRGGASDMASHERHLLRPFFDHVLLTAGGRTAGPHDAMLVFNDGLARQVTFAPLTMAEAREYLARLAADLMGGPHTYLLPCEAVFSWQKQPSGRLDERVDVVLERSSSRYGPIRRLDPYRPPPEDMARAMAERRFTPFFARLDDDPKSTR